jgi:predicted RND superfamily exporter protein
VFVVVLFGLLYRRVMPLVLLLVALYVTFVITLLLGEFIFQELGAMSVGFAAILMGLAVDYGFVIYQESCCSGKDPRELRPIFGRCIGWAAGTTACVFLFLNRSIMPGVTQLGTMVAIGIGVGALIMIFPYASALGRLRCYGHRNGEIASDARQSLLGSSFFAGWATAIGALMVVVVFYLMGFPKLNPDPESLLPEKRQASIELYKTVMERLGGDTRTLTVMGSSANDRQMLDILKRGKKILAADTTVTSAMIPTGLWPHIDLQNANRKVLAPLLEIEPEILAKAEAEGFTDEALLLTKRIFAAWREFVSHDQPFALKDPASEWLMKRLIQTDENSHLAIGFIRLVEDKFTIPFETIEALNAIGLRPIGWEFLGTEILAVLQHDIRHVVIPSAIVLLVLLAIVFRSVKGVCLSVALLVFSALGLMAVMRLIGMDWNIVNIAAAPLLLGLGLDYSIHVILALRRTHGNIPEIHRNIGRALLLCGTTTAVGFGSLRFARHGGLPMLGELCAIGILITMAVAIYLVPHWWCFLHRKELRERAEEDHSAVQSS